jgi:hypothetical protein
MNYRGHLYHGGQKPKLLDQVRQAIRTRHYSLRTEETYVQWIKRFILFHNKRHPKDMGAEEVTRFLSDLAVNHRVATSTQTQALSAILFRYEEVLMQEIPWLDDKEHRCESYLNDPGCALRPSGEYCSCMRLQQY